MKYLHRLVEQFVRKRTKCSTLSMSKGLLWKFWYCTYLCQ